MQIVCGNRAGALTCLLDETDKYDLPCLPHEEQPHFKVKTLYEIQRLIQTAVELDNGDLDLPNWNVIILHHVTVMSKVNESSHLIVWLNSFYYAYKAIVAFSWPYK